VINITRLDDRPVIGITIGDPAGIGPEICVKALLEREVYEISKPVVFGDVCVLKYYVDLLKADAKINVVDDPYKGKFTYGNIDIIDVGEIRDMKEIEIGKISAKAGRASARYVEEATKFALAKKIDAMVTAPINKEAWKLAGVKYIGHTEMLGELTNTKDPLTMFQTGSLRVFFLTRHVSLRQAIEMVKRERILDYIIRCFKMLESIGISRPRLAVAALNPHAGEHGLFGDEEIREIEPAVKEARERGFDVDGPIPADYVFWACLNGKYDAVLALYHDQGHIATKTRDFYKTVSVTLGMPFIRTSPDHGTSMSRAGKGTANHQSLLEAIKVAAYYVRKYKYQP